MEVSSNILVCTQIELLRICTKHLLVKISPWSVFQRWTPWRGGAHTNIIQHQNKLKLLLSPLGKNINFNISSLSQVLALLQFSQPEQTEKVCGVFNRDYWTILQEGSSYVMQTCFGAVLRSLTQNCSWLFIILCKEVIITVLCLCACRSPMQCGLVTCIGPRNLLGSYLRDLIGSILETGCIKEEFLPFIITPQMLGCMLNIGASPVQSQWWVLHSGNYAEAAVSFSVFNTIPLS